MRRRTWLWAATVVGAVAVPPALLWSAAQISSCCAPTNADFPLNGGNLGNQRYSGLTSISRDNVRNLGPAWRSHVSAATPATDDVGQQSSPVVADGVLYLSTPSAGVIAVDGATGTTRWKWQPTEFTSSGTRRGVAVGEGKVYALANGRVVALDQRTGTEVWVVDPTGPGGEPLGGIGKVATLYHDGLVYVGTNDGGRGSAFALEASTGDLVWAFYGGAAPGTVVTDVRGNTIDAGATWGPPREDGRSCAMTAGATPWMHGALDPDLGMAYYAFGNARSCGSSQDGSGRPGLNLFANSLVAVDLKTGEYRWHFQSVHHDVWDMDNVHPPLLADVRVGGETRRAIYYGSKSGHLFVLDRTDGTPLLAADEVPVPLDSRQAGWETQPFPNRPFPTCMIWQALDPTNVPGDPFRAVPNYNGYQPNSAGELVYTTPNYLEEDEPYLTYPSSYGATHRRGCLYDPHWDQPVLSTTSQNGGGDWSTYSFSHSLGLVYFPYGVNPVAHWRGAGGNGQRVRGQYQTGGVVAIDAATNTVRWRNHLGLDLAHGQSPLTTASDLLFIGQPDGTFLALDAGTGEELWRFQTGASIGSGPVTYMVDGEQYVAVFSAGTGIPYGGGITEGDALWAFKLGGTYLTESGSGEAPAPPPLTIRRPVGGPPVEGSSVNNTIYLARADRASDTVGDPDSVEGTAMAPSHLRVPVGTRVTFVNPGADIFPSFPNRLPHCATQFFEGLFHVRLLPGESYSHTFDRAGEYFFNDCTDPRPTGKVEVYLTPRDVPGALSFDSGTLVLTSSTGVFTGVAGVVAARFSIPAGYTLDGEVRLHTPLSQTPIPPVATRVEGGGRTLVADFAKADIDNNVPRGPGVGLVLSANFLSMGVQEQLTSTATVTVVK